MFDYFFLQAEVSLKPAISQASGVVAAIKLLCYSVMGISGFIAAIRIYNNIQLGRHHFEEIAHIAYWFFAAIFFIIGMAFISFILK